MVESMLEMLAISKCADTLIGGKLITVPGLSIAACWPAWLRRMVVVGWRHLGWWWLQGISGGEKKRTAIGVELISNPDILFLDEVQTIL